MTVAIEPHIGNGGTLGTVANNMGNGDNTFSVTYVDGPAAAQVRFVRIPRDSPLPNSCRFHRGVSDVSFCTSDHGTQLRHCYKKLSTDGEMTMRLNCLPKTHRTRK